MSSGALSVSAYAGRPELCARHIGRVPILGNFSFQFLLHFSSPLQEILVRAQGIEPRTLQLVIWQLALYH